jgi:predicted SnoaL-like aldol condensation-catalyzing enzyme
MNPSKQEKNKEIVLKAFDALFNQRDFKTAEQYWSPSYIQHSSHIKPGRKGLFELVQEMPHSHYENHLIMAEGDYVILHGRFLVDHSPNLIAADVVRMEDGKLAEHWDVLQNEATRQESRSGLPMFGENFPGE